MVDAATNVMAVEIAGQTNAAIKQIEKARKEFVEKPLSFNKSVNGLANGYKDKLQRIVNGLKHKIGEFAQAKELARRKAERAARLAADKENARLAAEAKKHNVEPVAAVEPVLIPKETKTRTAVATTYQHISWQFEVVDAAKVPRKYLGVDEKAIRRAVGDGIRNIPGVDIHEHTETRIR